jgi:hypothetical protein
LYTQVNSTQILHRISTVHAQFDSVEWDGKMWVASIWNEADV